MGFQSLKLKIFLTCISKIYTHLKFQDSGLTDKTTKHYQDVFQSNTMNLFNLITKILFPVSTSLESLREAQSTFKIQLHENNINSNSTEHLPVLLWHGMGDTYNSESMEWIADQIQQEHSNTKIFSIYIQEDGNQDRQASVFGNAMTQLVDVCNQVKTLDIDFSKGFNAIGFSQGGLFIRSLVQTCDIKFNNIVAVGSPQNGISDLPPCDANNWICKRRNEYIKSKMYTDYMQENNIQSQYFRDVDDYDTYLLKSSYLKFINNELFKDLEYFDRLISINKFVMIMFEQDQTLVPKESAWFWDLDPVTNSKIPFRDTESYKYDMIGLKTLDEQGKIDFLSINDVHLKMSDEDIRYLAKTYL